jgi:acetyl-CoA carboxylase biotin carboxylase subunit
MEVNPRIQVEHPVTEVITGIDIVEQQIRIARGEQLLFSQKDIHFNGWAIEARINAENPQKNFMPTPGVIKKYIPAGGQGIFVHSFLHEGQEIFPYFDSLVAKIIAHGKTRNEAITKMKRALDEMVIDGISTTIPFFKILLRHKEFLGGNYYSNFIEQSDILKEMMCTVDTHKHLEESLIKDINESELAEAIFQVYKGLKNKEQGGGDISKWTIANRLKMMR